jgi:hypothetical protein
MRQRPSGSLERRKQAASNAGSFRNVATRLAAADRAARGADEIELLLPNHLRKVS